MWIFLLLTVTTDGDLQAGCLESLTYSSPHYPGHSEFGFVNCSDCLSGELRVDDYNGTFCTRSFWAASSDDWVRKSTKEIALKVSGRSFVML